MIISGENCKLSAYQGLSLSQPLHTWDPNGGQDKQVAFDMAQSRVIHHQPAGFFAIDMSKGAGVREALFVKFQMDSLRCVRFSHDKHFFAHVSGKNEVGISETMQPSRGVQGIRLKWKKDKQDFHIHDMLWLPQVAPEFGELAIITTLGIEVFKFHFESTACNSRNRFQTPILKCWVQHTCAAVICQIAPTTLQPFSLIHDGATKMPKFDLVVDESGDIGQDEVAVVQLYNSVYCVHLDGSLGRVSLRELVGANAVGAGPPVPGSRPPSMEPEDIVLDVQHPGLQRLSIIDNLILINCVDRGITWIFDIRQALPPVKQDTPPPPLVSPVALPMPPDGDRNRPVNAIAREWTFLCGEHIFDYVNGQMYAIKLDMDAILRDIYNKGLTSVIKGGTAELIRFLLRRAGCKTRLVDALKRVLSKEVSYSGEMMSVFKVLNSTYRQAIESIPQPPSGQGGRATVSLAQLASYMGGRSLLSEKDMVIQVLHPIFMGLYGELIANKNANSWTLPKGKIADSLRTMVPPPEPDPSGEMEKTKINMPKRYFPTFKIDLFFRFCMEHVCQNCF